ncbi:hypothetical protein GTGU_03936 [Trabulsiella guamensis ATCC 49490]|uniref:Uncharacterized protein n=1 Tax=Trabulsiella guamensis ATCC 49490 TaxID=1005994 RepID=A0A084ZQS6_9ENTR|nr:hypothetical protein GTGU_03936 [Trabulsiella guamensis ATCC 49490]
MPEIEVFLRDGSFSQFAFLPCSKIPLKNKQLPGSHPHSDRKRLFAACFSIITLWGVVV